MKVVENRQWGLKSDGWLGQAVASTTGIIALHRCYRTQHFITAVKSQVCKCNIRRHGCKLNYECKRKYNRRLACSSAS